MSFRSQYYNTVQLICYKEIVKYAQIDITNISSENEVWKPLSALLCETMLYDDNHNNII